VVKAPAKNLLTHLSSYLFCQSYIGQLRQQHIIKLSA